MHGAVYRPRNRAKYWLSRTFGETGPNPGGADHEIPGKRGVTPLAGGLRSPKVRENPNTGQLDTRGTNPHGLRHQGITRALDLAKGDVRKVRRFSRHAKLETLLRYDDNRRDEAGAIAHLLGEDSA
jgi:hypothetical protein